MHYKSVLDQLKPTLDNLYRELRVKLVSQDYDGVNYIEVKYYEMRRDKLIDIQISLQV